MPTVKTVAVTSKPDQIEALRATWRKTTEHKIAQVKLFLSAFLGVLGLQVIGDLTAGRSLSHLKDPHDLWTYLLPLGLVAWRQLHPALTASAVDSAPGATIVPAEVTSDPAP